MSQTIKYNEIKVKDLFIFPKIISNIEIYSTFNFTPKLRYVKFQDIKLFIDYLHSLSKDDQIIVNDINFNEKEYLYLFIFGKTIFLVDQLIIQKNKNFFFEKKNSFLFLNDNLETDFFIRQSDLNDNLETDINQNDIFSFDNDFINVIKSKIIDGLVRKSQILTQRRHKKYLDFSNEEPIEIDTKTKYNINDFVNVKFLGNSVRLCYNINDQLLYVLKSFNKNKEDSVKCYEREFDFYKMVSNKIRFICKFFGIIREPKTYTLIIEYVEGQTLEQFILKSGEKQISFFDKMKIILEIIMTLEFIHYNNFILRDLKWDNIIIDQDKNAIFIDFDRARKENNKAINVLNTKDFGFEHFLAPEQFLYGDFSYKSDIYSIGMIIHFIITEKRYNDILTSSFLSDFYRSNQSIVNIKSFSCVSEEYQPLFDAYKKCFEYYSEFRPNATELFYSIINFIKNKKANSTEYVFLLNIRDSFLYLVLGISSFTQDDIPPNRVKKFLEYLNVTSKLNDSYSQYYLGLIYLKGIYLTKNINKFVYYMDLASQQNNINASLFLGYIYVLGNIIPRNINKAIHYLTIAADQNNKDAQFWLGLIYHSGEFIKPDINKAIHYLTLASNQNDQNAQLLLGKLYLKEHLIKVDINKSIHYLTLSANQNNNVAQETLGSIYYKGLYIERNINKSIDYYIKSANQGNAVSQFNLGLIYYTNIYVACDIKKAIYYFTLAAEQNYARAQEYLGSIYIKNEHIPRDVNKSIEYFTKSANQGNLISIHNLGIIYYTGEYVKRDINKAIYYFQIGSNKNIIESHMILGLFYFNGMYTKCDINKSLFYFKKASDQGNNPVAQYYIGFIYYKNEYNKRDINKAIHYFTLAADQGHRTSQYMLGLIYSDGEFVTRDIFKGIKYLTLSAEQFDEFALIKLGNIYLDGEYIQQNTSKAIELFKIAANLNNSEAQFILAKIYFTGNQVKQDINKGINFFMLSSLKNNRFAQLYLGVLYYDGRYLKRDINKAFNYFVESSVQLPAAKNNIGVIYMNESYIKKDVNKAIMYFEERIKEQKDIFSYYNLSRIYYFGKGVPRNVKKAFDLLEQSENIFPIAFIFLYLISALSHDENINNKENIYRNKVINANLYDYIDSNLDRLASFYDKYDLLYPFQQSKFQEDFLYFLCNGMFPDANTDDKNVKCIAINELFYEGLYSDDQNNNVDPL